MKIAYDSPRWTVANDAEGLPDFFSVLQDQNGTGAEIAGRIGEQSHANLLAAAPELAWMLARVLLADAVPGSVNGEAALCPAYRDQIAHLLHRIDPDRNRWLQLSTPHRRPGE